MKSSVIIGGVALVSILVILALFGPLNWKSVPLTSNLGSGKWTIISERFNERVKLTFPVGSSEKRMLEELQRQGFSLVARDATMGQEKEAVRREDDWVCNIAARVYWSAEENGRLVTIRGIYREEGCL